MKAKAKKINVQMIPIDQIRVANPRERDQKAFQLIVESIGSVGLKKPITVRRRSNKDAQVPYDLICGEGRLEAFVRLGEVEIPANVVDVTEKEAMVMSLVENLARRQHKPLELLREIGNLKTRGYTVPMIAKKTGMSKEYVHAICHLLTEGEERLLAAVESGRIPMSVALDIAGTEDEGVQEALADAYQRGLLRGKKLVEAKKLVERRRTQGKGLKHGPSSDNRKRWSSEELVRTYEREAERLRLEIKKAEIAENRLRFVVEALRVLLTDENFVNLLRAEDLETLPKPLAKLVTDQRAA